MSDAAPIPVAARGPGRHRGLVAAIILLAAAWLVPLVAPPWLTEWPQGLVVPVTRWIGAGMDWLVHDLSFGLFTFQDLTRAISAVLNLPLEAVNTLLWKGWKLSRATTIGPLSWLGLIIGFTILMHGLGGRRLAVFTCLSLAYMAAFGLWKSSMMTLASILIAVPFGCIAGLLFGVLAVRSKRAERAVIVLLDFMQTVPVFAYLLPVLLLFGFSPVSAMLATMIYAMPAMARATILGLKTVPPEVIELGRMSGATRRQMMWKVRLPSAAPTLVIGVNQVVVLSLNAVIIASLIGAGGLGFDVLTALRTLRIGKGLEAGLAIVLIAVVLDRAFSAWRALPPATHESLSRPWQQRFRPLIWAIGITLVLSVLAHWVPWLRTYPKALQLSFGHVVETAIDYITINYYPAIESVSGFLYLNVLNPIRDTLLALPWSVVIAALFVAGYLAQGRDLALTVAGLALAILLSGFWHEAMITVYLIGVSTVIAMLIGMPLGVLGSMNDRLSAALRLLCDTLQTLPSFVYLVPVVMLFRVGDIPAIIAVVLYAVTPAIRYTDLGLRKVDASLIEASRSMGTTRWQRLWRVQLPLALPEILLGLNQTIMLAISMLVITALVGTQDLGQVVYVGLARADTGLGLVAGACVAFIAIIADRLIQAVAARRKAALGLY